MDKRILNNVILGGVLSAFAFCCTSMAYACGIEKGKKQAYTKITKDLGKLAKQIEERHKNEEES